MLSVNKLNELCRQQRMNVDELGNHLIRGGFGREKAVAAVRNWQRGLLKPKPSSEDIRRLATALSVEVNELTDWRSSYRFAPISARKAKLVTQLIVGRSVQDAMDILKFTRKRAATMIDKVLRAAVSDADERQADVDNLYVSEAHVDSAGVRLGTKRWMPKDRGRAHPIRREACHIHITVTQA